MTTTEDETFIKMTLMTTTHENKQVLKLVSAVKDAQDS